MESYKHKVNYYETDKMGITHHSNYIRFMEEARVYFLEQIGWGYDKFEEKGIISPVVSVTCNYKHTSTFTDEIERFEELKFVLIEKNNQLVKYEIKEVKYQKQMVLLKLNGIDNMNQAETFKGCYLKIERKYAKKLPEDTYFIADLIGLNVYTDEGKLLGRLEDIYNSGSSDIYVVKNELGKQILLPAIKDVIKQIDLNDEKIVVHLLKGLVED